MIGAILYAIKKTRTVNRFGKYYTDRYNVNFKPDKKWSSFEECTLDFYNYCLVDYTGVVLKEYNIDLHKFLALLSSLEIVSEGKMIGKRYLPVESLTDEWTLRFLLNGFQGSYFKYVNLDLSSDDLNKYITRSLFLYFNSYSPGFEMLEKCRSQALYEIINVYTPKF